MKSLSFNSLQGFKELIIDHTRFPERLTGLIDSLSNSKGNLLSYSDYKQIYLIDTFFSDSFPQNQLTKLLGKCFSDDLEIKILLLNPFSELGVLRSKALEQDRFEEINKAIFKLIEATLMNTSQRNKLADLTLGFKKNKSKPDYIIEQLEVLEILKGDKIKLSIKFYNELTDVPIYIIGPYVIKGTMLHKSSAKLNPWMIFVDDQSQKNDIYDNFVSSFRSIWKIAFDRPIISRVSSAIGSKVFVSYGHNVIYKELIIGILKEFRYTPITYSEDNTIGASNLVNLEKLTQSSGACIAILSKEDLLDTGNFRARQNVIHELGYCQAFFGKDKVLSLIEKGVEIPSNISGINGGEFSDRNITKLKRTIKRFLDKSLK